jgi:hypothetical protein
MDIMLAEVPNAPYDSQRPNISFDGRRTNLQGKYTVVNNRAQVTNADYPYVFKCIFDLY